MLPMQDGNPFYVSEGFARRESMFELETDRKSHCANYPFQQLNINHYLQCRIGKLLTQYDSALIRICGLMKRKPLED